MKTGESKLIYPELSYRIVGIVFRVYNQLGGGYQEKYFSRALAVAFEESGLKFEREKEIKLWYGGKLIGKHFLDFIIEDKIILELKIGPETKHIHLRQTLGYLNSTKLKLALLICFTLDGVRCKRIINPNLI